MHAYEWPTGRDEQIDVLSALLCDEAALAKRLAELDPDRTPLLDAIGTDVFGELLDFIPTADAGLAHLDDEQLALLWSDPLVLDALSDEIADRGGTAWAAAYRRVAEADRPGDAARLPTWEEIEAKAADASFILPDDDEEAVERDEASAEAALGEVLKGPPNQRLAKVFDPVFKVRLADLEWEGELPEAMSDEITRKAFVRISPVAHLRRGHGAAHVAADEPDESTSNAGQAAADGQVPAGKEADDPNAGRWEMFLEVPKLTKDELTFEVRTDAADGRVDRTTTCVAGDGPVRIRLCELGDPTDVFKRDFAEPITFEIRCVAAGKWSWRHREVEMPPKLNASVWHEWCSQEFLACQRQAAGKLRYRLHVLGEDLLSDVVKDVAEEILIRRYRTMYRAASTPEEFTELILNSERLKQRLRSYLREQRRRPEPRGDFVEGKAAPQVAESSLDGYTAWDIKARIRALSVIPGYEDSEIEAALQRRSPREREVIRLHLIECLSHPEVAQSLRLIGANGKPNTGLSAKILSDAIKRIQEDCGRDRRGRSR